MKLLGRLKDKATNQLIIAVVGVVFLFLVVAYFVLDTLNVYDAAGHVLAVFRGREFWPSWQGWTPELLGWSQGSLYPPAIHWVMTGLSFVTGVPLAIKLVVVLSIIALPISIWKYLRSAKYSISSSLIAFVSVIVVMLMAPDYMGSSIKSLFTLGLITNFVALPLLFFFMASVERTARNGKLTDIVLSGALLGILILSHFVVSVIGVLYLLAVILEKVIRRNYKPLVPLFKLVLITLVISGLFIIRIVTLSTDQFDTGGGIVSLLLPSLMIFISSAVISVYLFKQKEVVAFRLAVLALLLSLVCTLDGLLVRLFGTSYVIERFHVYRFQVFAFIFFVISAVVVVAPKLKKLNSKKLLAVKGGLALALIVSVVLTNPFKFNYVNVTVGEDAKISGRFLESFSRSESYPAPYAFQSKLAMSNKDTAWAHGLFVESSPNAPFVKSLSISLTKERTDDPKVDQPIETVILPKGRIGPALDLFAIENVVSLGDNPTDAAGIWARGNVKKYYHIDNLNGVKLAEVPSLKLVPVKFNWKKTVSQWWKGSGTMSTLPYDATQGIIPGQNHDPMILVEVDKFSNGRISLYVNSASSVPVLIKVTYSPEWKAYDGNGKEIKIWKAAPSLMLVNASGRVNLIHN